MLQMLVLFVQFVTILDVCFWIISSADIFFNLQTKILQQEHLRYLIMPSFISYKGTRSLFSLFLSNYS